MNLVWFVMQNNLDGKHSIITNTASELTVTSCGGLLDCVQAAHYLNVSESLIRKKVASNSIPYVRIGTRTLFRRPDLDEWIAKRVVRTNDDIASQAASLTASTALRQSRRGAYR